MRRVVLAALCVVNRAFGRSHLFGAVTPPSPPPTPLPRSCGCRRTVAMLPQLTKDDLRLLVQLKKVFNIP